MYGYDLNSSILIVFCSYFRSFILGSDCRFLDERIEGGVFEILCFVVVEIDSKFLGFI